MTDKLMPTEHDGERMPAFPGEPEGGLGLPGLSGAGSAGGLSASADKPKVSGQVLLAGLVLALAGGAIYGMRFVGLNAGFGDDGVKIDYTSQAGAPEASRRFDKVMNELDASMAAVQVANTDEIPPSPFTRPKAAADEPMVFAEPETMDDLDRMARMAAEQRQAEREARAALVRGELARLHVQGIIGGRVPAARINGQPVTVGQSMGVFRVVDISGGSVFVEVDGDKYELRIGSEPRLAD